MGTIYRVLLWIFGIALALTAFSACTAVVVLAPGEDICLDRRPWWGPPESGTNPSCAGHIYDNLSHGRRVFGAPK